ncbi:MAG: hypothetical protein ACQKBW_08490, partial [Puniceicoccales bacterium]
GTIVVIPMMILQKLFGLALPGPGKVVKAGAEGVSAALDKEEAETRAKAAAGEAPADGSESAEADAQLGMGVAIPFGPWLALGGLVYFLFMRGPADAYLSTLRALIFAPFGGPA